MNTNHFILYLFFFLTLIIGYISGRKIKTIRDFSISHKSYSTPILVATIFATVIGGGSTFGIIEKNYLEGFIYTFVFMGMAFNRILVGYFVAPHISTLNESFFTLPSYMKKYYGKWGSVITAICTLLVSIGSVGTQTFTIGFILKSFFGFSTEISVILGCGILILYSSFGGMRSVVATDVFQFLLIGTLVPMLLSASIPKVGGINNLINGISSHFLPSHSLSYLTLGGVFLSFLFGSADPSFLQRLLVAKDHKQAKISTVYTGYISILFYIMVGIIGVITFLAFPGEEGRGAFIKLVEISFPSYLQAFIVCGLLAAVMSTADSDLNMVGISMAEDLFQEKNFSEKQKLKIARISTLVLGIGSVYVAMRFNNILDIIMYAFSFWAPSVLIPLMGCFFHRKVSLSWMLLGVGLGFLITQVWNIYLEPITKLDGIVPGMIIHAILFMWKSNKTYENY